MSTQTLYLKAANEHHNFRNATSIRFAGSAQEIRLTFLAKLYDRPMSPVEIHPLYSRLPVTINKCPIHLLQLSPLRGFKLGASLTEFARSFQSTPPSVPEPDYLGVRSVKFYWSQGSRGPTDLDKLEFRFFDDRLYQIEANYSVGTEWEERPLSEFAEAISHGLGVEATWTESPGKRFKLECGEVRFDLWIMEPLMSRSSLPVGQMASAFLTLTATDSEAQIRRREEVYRGQQQQRDAERRKVFKP